MPMRVFAFLLLALARCAPGTAGAFPADGFGSDPFGFSLPAFGEKKLLEVTLVTGSKVVAPGVPFTVVLNFRHLGDGYTYWTNPGGPGQGSAISWRLPPGFMVSQPDWPAPRRHENAGIVSYIYRGTVPLPFTITPPAALKVGESFDIAADIATQVCTPRTCMPVKLAAAAVTAAASSSGWFRGREPTLILATSISSTTPPRPPSSTASGRSRSNATATRVS